MSTKVVTLETSNSTQPIHGLLQVLILTGPVKCGKTDVLHLVLPSIIALEHTASQPRPFIFRFTFDLRQGPEMAALTLLEAAKRAALSFSVPIDYAPGWALRNIDAILGELALALVKKNAELWLLMDECQVLKLESVVSALLLVIRLSL